MSDTLRLDSGQSTLAFSIVDGRLGASYIGKRLHSDTAPAYLHALTAPVIAHGELDRPALNPAFPTRDGRPQVMPALGIRRGGAELLVDLRVNEHRATAEEILLTLCDRIAGLEVQLCISAVAGSCFEIKSVLKNLHEHDLAVDWIASAHLCIPQGMSRVISQHGFWANEFQRKDSLLGDHLQSWISDRGRSSHGSAASLVIAEDAIREEFGEALMMTLMWPGNHRLSAAPTASGSHAAQAGIQLDAGELSLPPGETFPTPTVLIAHSTAGMNGLRKSVNAYWNQTLAPHRSKPTRPVHFNSWEGCYFDHDEERILVLIEEARSLGAERFILDDGWMAGRTEAGVGLGDWTPCPGRYPRGLNPVADAARAAGMEFGIWLEPEMVTADSAVAHDHPDWLIAVADRDRIAGRSQYLLNLGREDVRRYIAERIDAVIADCQPGYVKWDMNRDHAQIGTASGSASLAMAQGFIGLARDFRTRHPKIELELCGAGGARSDAGAMLLADRLWPTDSLDPVQRFRVLRNSSLLLPPARLGWHIGSATTETSGASYPTSTRCMLALLGHMGVELNPASMASAERATVAHWIEVFKKERNWLEKAELLFLDTGIGEAEAVLLLDDTKDRALLFVFQTAYPPKGTTPQLRLRALHENKHYRLSYLNPEDTGFAQQLPGWMEEKGAVLPGELLQLAGLRLPPLRLGHCALIRLESAGSQ